MVEHKVEGYEVDDDLGDETEIAYLDLCGKMRLQTFFSLSEYFFRQMARLRGARYAKIATHFGQITTVNLERIKPEELEEREVFYDPPPRPVRVQRQE